MRKSTHEIHREEVAVAPGIAPTTNVRLVGDASLDGPAVLVRVERADGQDGRLRRLRRLRHRRRRVQETADGRVHGLKERHDIES